VSFPGRETRPFRKRWRRWRLARAYSRVRDLERGLAGDLTAAELRRDFAAESVDAVDAYFRETGQPRADRRRFKRAIIK
jgi:hypothetical protein